MKIRILLIDDAAFIRDLIKRTLRRYLPDCEIIEAQDGRRAQSLLLKQPVDLILSDWEMPTMSGEELLLWVRAQEKTAAIPFIMISSLGDKTHIMRAVEGGVTDYLGKPFTSEELTQKVHKALLKAERVKQARERLKSTGVLHFDDRQLKCMVKAIDAAEMTLIARRADTIPAVFDTVKVDLSPGNDAATILRDLAGYVHGVVAVERKPDAEFVSIAIRFDSADAHTKEQLERMLRATGQPS